jgi:hypothetical protein
LFVGAFCNRCVAAKIRAHAVGGTLVWMPLRRKTGVGRDRKSGSGVLRQSASSRCELRARLPVPLLPTFVGLSEF